MPGFRFLTLGIGDAFSELYYSTSFALIADDGRWLLVDCPHPIRKILREACLAAGIDLPLENLVGVALTHLHSDHCSGLEGLGAYAKYVLKRPTPLTVYCGPKVADVLRTRPEADWVEIRPVTDPVAVGPFNVAVREVTHGNTPAYALRVSSAGRTVGHSGDTVFDPALIGWLAEADQFIHEANAKTRENPVHTAYERLAELPADVRKKLRLAHFPDDFDARASIIEPLEQGRLYEV